ncbi:hypothetical protein [Paramaledivibacter caminithermalis]|jgi:LmbE family N-acetylglucosaminyl deacetylase|uniref:Uncharacterized protein n=1 Tax=Paramaledivibacter caminithermalis (strain DSM 15212 / CIP 107654 / DViRD3) TaxID=1121301 RepID=A0A1M6MTP1_PARC5|nr:hypothetical protein [Paramaledivibacter caminithermalis]SHJ86782.1 hypothetical protein SAMN02745912_01419 [Paramaledivibacter caminithermalis DSM 15212]
MPNLLVDISDVYEQKQKAIASFSSQFDLNNYFQSTILNHKFLKHMKNRDRYYGSLISTDYAEGLIFEGKLYCNNLFQIITFNN